MNWNGKELVTVGDLGDAVVAIARSGDQAEADRFMAQYRAETPHADTNIGYLSGYYDPERMSQIQRMFGVAHPVFGTRTDVTADEAVEAGKQMAREHLSGR